MDISIVNLDFALEHQTYAQNFVYFPDLHKKVFLHDALPNPSRPGLSARDSGWNRDHSTHYSHGGGHDGHIAQQSCQRNPKVNAGAPPRTPKGGRFSRPAHGETPPSPTPPLDPMAVPTPQGGASGHTTHHSTKSATAKHSRGKIPHTGYQNSWRDPSQLNHLGVDVEPDVARASPRLRAPGARARARRSALRPARVITPYRCREVA